MSGTQDEWFAGINKGMKQWRDCVLASLPASLISFLHGLWSGPLIGWPSDWPMSADQAVSKSDCSHCQPINKSPARLRAQGPLAGSKMGIMDGARCSDLCPVMIIFTLITRVSHSTQWSLFSRDKCGVQGMLLGQYGNSWTLRRCWWW